MTAPENYTPILDPRETERAILKIKDHFQTNLAYELNLNRVTAPLFVEAGTGVNDDLNGVEKPVSFPVSGLGGRRVEIVQSLAKWKRMTLADLGFEPGSGLYTDMNAVRPDDAIDRTHSIYVDQWDWERVMAPGERTTAFLRSIVATVYDVIRRTERFICHEYPRLTPMLPDTIAFVHTEELFENYPKLSPREREYEACRKYGAVFIQGIGGALPDGTIHDGRAPDYDDWSSPDEEGRSGMNGDIFVYNSTLDDSFELSSMGIRVDPIALDRQLRIRNLEARRELAFHKRLLAGELPQTIGGGIGQSRLCMLYLRKAHIGEIQASVWPEEMRRILRANGIPLL